MSADREKGSRAALLLSHTLGHFCVDFSTIFLAASCIFSPGLDSQGVLLAVLFYNLTAFLLQPLAGALNDAFPKLRLAAWGYGTVLLALLFSPLPWAALGIGALGNAMFHAGAGRDVLLDSGGRLKWGGIFVSSGALGVPLGTLAAGAGLSVLLPAALTVLALWLAFLCRGRLSRLPKAASFHTASGLSFGVVLALALLSVAVRAFVGNSIPMPWKSGLLVVIPGLFSCLGKACGGFLADRFGPRRVGVLSLLCSIPLLCLGSSSIWLSAAGILLFNCTMPISLGTVAAKLPVSPGLAFGLTAQLLVVGSLPLYLWPLPGQAALPLSAVLTLCSALCIWLSTNNQTPVQEVSK